MIGGGKNYKRTHFLKHRISLSILVYFFFCGCDWGMVINSEIAHGLLDGRD